MVTDEEYREFLYTIDEARKIRILEPQFLLSYYLGTTRSDFYKMGRKELEYTLKRLQEEIDRNNKGGRGDKSTVSADDPSVRHLMPNPTGKPHTNPRNHRS